MEQFRESDRWFTHEGKQINISALSDDELTSLFEFFDRLHDVPEIMIGELYSRWKLDDEVNGFLQLGTQRGEE